MDGGKDLHGRVARIDSLELLVNLEDAAQLAVEFAPWNVRQIQVDALPVLLDAQPFVHADIEDLARGDVARHEVAVFGIAILEKIVPLGFGNVARIAGSCGVRGTQTRPPSPRADSLISRSLSAPGMAVG